MSTRSQVQGASPAIPTATTALTLVSGGSTSVDLSSLINCHVEFRGTVDWNARSAAATATATAGDMPRTADSHYHFKITREAPFVAVYAASAGTLYYGKSPA